MTWRGFDPSADMVFALREERGIGLMEAKRILVGRRLRQSLATCNTEEELRAILGRIIEDLYPE